MTISSGGFAPAAEPLSAHIIATDTTGLVAGWVMIAAHDGELPAYRAMPQGRDRLPVVLVVQEIFGVHEHIQDVCRRFAKAGYLAIAPELYDRQGDASKYADIPKLVEDIVSRVADSQVMSDLDAAIRWSTKNGGNADKMAVSGFCWGGRITWLYALHNPRLKAGVAWYGGLVRAVNPMTPQHPIDIAADLTVPVLGLYGGADAGIPNESVKRMQAALAAGGSGSTIHLYADTPHAFYADYRPSYRKEQAQDAWKRCLAWLTSHGVS